MVTFNLVVNTKFCACVMKLRIFVLFEANINPTKLDHRGYTGIRLDRVVG